MENARVIAVRTNKTIYRQDDKVIKVFDPDYSKADVLNEALNQAYVEETGLKIPKVLEVMKVDGNWAIVSQYIPGKTLAQLMEQDPANEAAYLTRMIELQSEIHSKRSPMLNRLSEKMQRKISNSYFLKSQSF